MTSHVFVDETKNRGYVVVAGSVVETELQSIRRELRRLIMPGQRRLHMSKERDQRRRLIVDTIAAAGVTAAVYDAGLGSRNELAARATCLRAVVTAPLSARPPCSSSSKMTRCCPEISSA